MPTLSPALCPRSPQSLVHIFILHTSPSPSSTHGPHFSSPLASASLLKLGAPVITTLSPLTLLTHSLTPSLLTHSFARSLARLFTRSLTHPFTVALLTPLSSCPWFRNQSCRSGINIAELVGCWSARWFNSIAAYELRRQRLMRGGEDRRLMGGYPSTLC